MPKNSISTLSKKRIYITLFLFLCIPVFAHIINIVLQQYDISLMFSLTVFGGILIIYDWNLFAIHYNRMKSNLLITGLYTIIGSSILFLWTWLALNFLSCRVNIPNEQVLASFGYARISMLIAYSFFKSAAICITFKAMTDRFRIHHHELQIIIISGILFGFVYTFLFLPSFNLLTILSTLFYNIITMTFMSYLYNQTNTFFVGMLSLAFCDLAYMLWLL